MLAGRINRVVRRHFRAALVWAAIPLAAFNGRTVVGCGCFGHFEAVCHCGCCGGTEGHSACSCCSAYHPDHSNCSCCLLGSQPTARCSVASHEPMAKNGSTLERHHCTSIAMRTVVPATVTHSIDLTDLHSWTLAIADHGLPPSNGNSHLGSFSEIDTGPPPGDLVVILHRLVI